MFQEGLNLLDHNFILVKLWDNEFHPKSLFLEIHFIEIQDPFFLIRSQSEMGSERTSIDKIIYEQSSSILKIYKIIEVNNFYNNLDPRYHEFIGWVKSWIGEKDETTLKVSWTEFIKSLKNYKILWNGFYRSS
jgi:hypothetical protein